MKRIHNYILLSVLAFAAAGCVEDNFNNGMPSAESGDEVQFGLSLDNPKTRTVYGTEDETKNESGVVTASHFPIYWVDGDKVQIFSPQCLEDRRNAEYEIILPTVDSQGNPVLPYFADELIPTGENGVQWGGSQTADFYSIYPSGKYIFSFSDNTKTAENVVIANEQHVVVDGGNIQHEMKNCLMYAKTTGVQRGEIVNLHYDPISTVVMLTLKVAANADAYPDEFTIQSISLVAPSSTNIAGTFSLNLETGTCVDFTTAYSTTTVRISNTASTGYHTLKNGESITVPVFLAPGKYSIEDWKVEVVANGNKYTKTLGITEDLVSGQIHKITLPELKPASKDWEVDKWMTYIPRNVYLSEVSIPGTWNSLNEDCQSVTNIAEQYKLGVRAFHLDTRWKADNDPWMGETFTGITKPTITELSVATGGSGNTYKYDGGNLMKPSFKSFADYLGQITKEVKEDEYMVVFCTFAQNSYNGDRCPSTWYEAVSKACAENEKVYDAKSITANTLVGDVLNKVIVIVNLDSSVSSTELPANSKCLFTYIPMQLPKNYYEGTTSHTDALYYSTKSESGISMYTSHAQISTTGSSSVDCGDRGYSHPLTSRDALVTSFWDWSKNNYGTTNYMHNKWIYLGLGGYIMTSSSSNGSGYETIENRYAPMIYDRIDQMGKNNVPYYPVGIILMNHKHEGNYTITNGTTTTDLNYNFSDVCKKVLMLNNKYPLQFDPNKPTDYKPATKSAAVSYSSGMNDQGVSAFGWE